MGRGHYLIGLFPPSFRFPLRPSFPPQRTPAPALRSFGPAARADQRRRGRDLPVKVLGATERSEWGRKTRTPTGSPRSRYHLGLEPLFYPPWAKSCIGYCWGQEKLSFSLRGTALQLSWINFHFRVPRLLVKCELVCQLGLNPDG